jgi:hypothetical protein
MSAARKLDPPRAYTPEDRLAMLRVLPVSDEPPTAEEDGLFDEIETEVRSGAAGGVSMEEITATIEQMRRDQST